MSIITELKYTTNLDKGVCMTPITPSFMGGDKEAHRFVIDCYRQNSREPVDLSGAGVTAYFVRADGTTIPLAGETNGSKASVLLPAACYAVMGRFSLVIKLSMDDGTADSISTVFWGEGAVSRSRTDVVIDPDSVIPSLEELLAQIAAMEIATNNANAATETANAAAAQAVEIATAKGNEALQNVADAVTAQNETIGQLTEEFNNASNIRAETFTDASYINHNNGTLGEGYNPAKASDYVPILPGAVITLYGYVTPGFGIANIIGLAFYTSEHAYISGVGYGEGETIVAKVPNNAAYVRYTVYKACLDSHVLTQNTGAVIPLLMSKKVAYSDDWKRTGRENLDAIGKYVDTTLQMQAGYYVSVAQEGAVAAVGFGAVSDFVPVDKIAAVYTCLTSVLAICFYDADKAYISGITDKEELPKVHYIDPPDGAVYMRASCDTRKMSSDVVAVKTLYGDTLNYVEDISQVTPEMESGKYVATVNNGMVSPVYYSFLSDYIDLYGVTRVYTALTPILSICYYDFDKNYISGITAEKEGYAAWYAIDPPAEATYMRVSHDSRVTSEDDVKIEYSEAKKIGTKSALDVKNTKKLAIMPDQNIIAMYDTVVCIGDSLTWSQVYTSESSRQAFRTYGAVLGALCGVEAKTYARPGDTAITWWTRSSAGAFDNHGLYIVFLGTNSGVTDTIDADCVGDDPDNFAVTLTGQYGRILQTITNNGDKAVLVLPWAGGGESLATTQNVIRKFGTKYNFPVIDITFGDMRDDAYHKYPDGTGRNDLHYNDLGYAKMANVIMQKINSLSLDEQYKIMRTQ